jgi:hypothetical protein
MQAVLTVTGTVALELVMPFASFATTYTDAVPGSPNGPSAAW